MRKTFFVLASVVCASSAFAVELPTLSPAAKVSQTIGLTQMSVEYSSPGVRGRTVWGPVVAYGEVWRAGANTPTKLSFDRDITVGATVVPAGTYAFFVIPQKTGNWTVILNKDTEQWGSFNYKKDLDVVRLEVKPETIGMQERLTYSFPDFNHENGVLAVAWEKVRLSVPFKLSTDAQVAKNLQAMLDDEWRNLNQAARYNLEQKKDYDAGLKFADMSISKKEEWFNVWTKAQLLAAKGNYKEAYPLAQKAQTLGEKNPQGFFYANNVKDALRDWKAKS